ncbi:hypothetical protein PHLGIDRAFT_78912 [Phlebiopsis gigantea 11061_1 CR5-6]|uniref:DUF6533 domain-containing protein n=1 Tax=Phlebiopsis gigantea (strain 11061_1 CR5-6) TaxID=745531 RepID=A0A0C3S3T5_PHLG1|nr:hypothetical protein PHLGIDRAFT_78912 [Phlebiopsis gigantea 11061_1 CR5-6]
MFYSLALVVYEYAITVNQELTFIWKRKLTGATALFVANRYLSVLLTIIQIAPSLPIEWYVLLEHKSSIFSALRVYAIWGRNTMFFIAVLLPNMVPFATNIVSIKLTYTVVRNNMTLPLVKYATRISVIVADALVLLLTWWKTFRDAREVLSLKMNISLTTLLIRDGMHKHHRFLRLAC